MDETADAQPEGRKRGSYAKGIRRRQEILDRALEIFSEQGYDRTSLRSIGQALGVTHAALLHYFPSKDALLVEVLRERDARGSGEPAPPGLAGLIRGAEYNATVPGLISLYTSMAATSADAGNDEARAYFTERFARLRARIAEALATDAGEPVGAGHLNLASLIIAASDGLQIQWLLDDSVDIAGGLELLQRLIERS
jgi:TetR/AcrR family transcriptional regulator, transcriptional repressor of aconitase